MTPDLGAIDVLSDRYSESLTNHNRFKPQFGLYLGFGGATLFLGSEDEWKSKPIIMEGEKILRLYEGELANAPNDSDVKRSLARHLFRIGEVYAQAANTGNIAGSSRDHQTSWSVESKLKDALFAQRACHYFHQSFSLIPSTGAAYLLAVIFNEFSFFGSTSYWYSQVEMVGNSVDDEEIVNEVKADRISLRVDGKTTDPPVSADSLFPNSATRGLLIDGQPPEPTPLDFPVPQLQVKSSPAVSPTRPSTTPSTTVSGNSTGGCGGVLLLTACIAVGIVLTRLH